MSTVRERTTYRDRVNAAKQDRVAQEARTSQTFTRLIAAALVIVSILFIDIGLCRLHYHYHLFDLKSMKEVALKDIKDGVCPGDQEQPLEALAIDRNCTQISCTHWANTLSEARQSALRFVRDVHPVGGWMAGQFDLNRGTDQNVKLQKMLAEKQCNYVIESSVRSNSRADMGSFIALLLGIAGLVAAHAIWYLKPNHQ